jgi:hypothetical protein
MSKIVIEWKDGAAWKQSSADVKCTRNNNLMTQHDGQILVFASLREGCEVVGLENGKWVKVGRVTRQGIVFLGQGLSYSEQCEQLFKGQKKEEMLAVKF